jgi:hypothetical protein
VLESKVVGDLTMVGPSDDSVAIPPPDANSEAAANGREQWPGIVGLMRPHAKLLAFGLIAVVGEGAANLLEPWPLKLAR